MERITRHLKKRPPNGSRKPKIFFMLPVALVIAVTSAIAQDDLFDGSSSGRGSFYVNVLYFRADDGAKTLIEVLVEVPHSSLRFVRTDVGYEAGLEVGVIFDDADGFQIDGHSISDTVRMNNFDAARSNSQAQLFCFRFPLEPGPYALRVMVDDKHANRRLSANCRINAPFSLL